jgi:mannose-6-phosphate isomerase-like protein (cupin superfamily)
MRSAPEVPEHLWFLSTLARVRVAHEEGADGLSVIEFRTPCGDSPALHIHHTEDELFHILEGKFRFVMGGEERRVGPDEVFVVPKGVPHTYRVESPEGARFLVVTTRGDFERLVRELSRVAERAELPPASGPPTPEQVQAIAAVSLRHNTEVVGPPLT